MTIDKEFKELLPYLDNDEQSGLEERILAEGIRDPLVVWSGQDILVDGHNRYAIAQKHGLDYDIEYIEFDDRDAVLTWIEENALARRNLSPDQASLLRGRLYNRRKKAAHRPEKAHQNDVVKSGSTAAKIADQYGVSKPTIERDGQYAEAHDKVKKVAPIPKAAPKKAVIQAAKLIEEKPEEALQILNAPKKGAAVTKAIKRQEYGHGDIGDEWYTPLWLFESLGLEFDIDVCGPVDRAHVTTPAKAFYTEAEDGLAQPWYGLVWCNPPYSAPEPWALKMVEHGNGVMLSHIPMNAKWCMDVWNACDGIRLFQAMEFIRPDGSSQRPGTWLQLAAFGTVALDALSRLRVPEHIAENPRRVPSPLWRAS